MIEIKNVSVARGGNDILIDASLFISRGERVGVVGPNGAGKTTLFTLLIGELQPDKGSITIQKGLKVGYLRQQLYAPNVDDNILDYAENAVSAVRNIQHEILALEHAVPAMTGDERDRALRQLGQLQTEFENSGGYELAKRAKIALGGLGFTTEAMEKPFNSFSGGWQMRAELARALVAMPDILLLDEPTNFLDIPAVNWLDDFLREYPGTLILISHDRYLLNTLTTVTYEINRCKMTRYTGNYDYYARERIQRYEQLLSAKKNQDRQRAQVERFIERFKATSTKSSLVQSRVKQLEKLEEIEVPRIAMPTARLRVAAPPHCGIEVMRLEDAGVTYDGTNWVLRHIDLSIQRGDKLGLIGLNGKGKTTLLRSLAGILPLSEGKRTLGHKVIPGYQAQDFAEIMDPELTVFETLKSAAAGITEQAIRNLLGSFLFSGDDIHKPIQVLSGGEKMRIAFARLLLNPPNFLLLDEPTTHLDIGSREMLERALQDYEGTLCLVSHDIQFVKNVATNVIHMDSPGITRYYGNYDYYCEKAAKQQAAMPVAAEESATQDKGPSKKELRRERAQQREELRKTLQPLQREMKNAETRIAALEKEQAALLEQLSADAQGKDYSAINRRLYEIRIETDKANATWERAGLKLEEINKTLKE